MSNQLTKAFSSPQSDSSIDARSHANSLKSLSHIGNALIVYPGADGDNTVLSYSSSSIMSAAINLSSLIAKEIDKKGEAPDWLVANLNSNVSLPFLSNYWQERNGEMPSDEYLAILADSLVSLSNQYARITQPSQYIENDDQEVALTISLISAMSSVTEEIQYFHSYFPKKNPFAEPDELLGALLKDMSQANERAMELMDLHLSTTDRLMLNQTLIQASGRLLSGLVKTQYKRAIDILFEMSPQEREAWAKKYPHGLSLPSLQKLFNRMHNALTATASLQVQNIRTRKTADSLKP